MHRLKCMCMCVIYIYIHMCVAFSYTSINVHMYMTQTHTYLQGKRKCNLLNITYEHNTCTLHTTYNTLQYYIHNIIYINSIIYVYGTLYYISWVAAISRLLRIIGFFCRIQSLFYRSLLQKRPVILKSLLIEATPYAYGTLEYDICIQHTRTYTPAK